VEPVTSQKRMVTVLRCSRGAADLGSWAPQWGQNAKSPSLPCPQFAQTTTSQG
jgi:hypothetical protein